MCSRAQRHFSGGFLWLSEKKGSCHCMAASVKTAVSLLYDGFSDTRLLFSNKRLDLCLPQSNEGTSSWEDRRSRALSETPIKCGLSPCQTALFFFFVSCLETVTREEIKLSAPSFQTNPTAPQPPAVLSLRQAVNSINPPSGFLNKQESVCVCVWLSDQKPPSVWAPRCPRLISPC